KPAAPSALLFLPPFMSSLHLLIILAVSPVYCASFFYVFIPSPFPHTHTHTHTHTHMTLLLHTKSPAPSVCLHFKFLCFVLLCSIPSFSLPFSIPFSPLFPPSPSLSLISYQLPFPCTS